MPTTRRSRFRVLVAGALALGLAFGALVAAPALHAARARPIAALTSRFPLRLPLASVGFCRCAPDSTLTLRRADGLRLAASLYGLPRGASTAAGVASAPPRPGLLLLHGLTPLGRNLPVYRVLAHALAERGFVVMTVDFAGFGESDDPYRLHSLAALDAREDVRVALRALRANPAVSRAPITLIGHSMGAIEAMEVGASDPAVGRVVAFGPPRRTAAILATEKGRSYHWDRIRRTYDSVYHRPLPAWYTRETFLSLKAGRDIEKLLPVWRAPGHRPLLLLDCGEEAAADRAYLAAYHQRLGAPAGDYVTVPATNHYLGSSHHLGLELYDRAAVRFAADTIARWAAAPRS